MGHVIGCNRNVVAMMLPGFDRPVPQVEVVLLTSQAVYGLIESEGGEQLGKGQAVSDLRFLSSPNGCRELAARLVRYADEAEAAFGPFPEAPDHPEAGGLEPEMFGSGVVTVRVVDKAT